MNWVHLMLKKIIFYILGEITMSHLEQTIGIIIATIAVVLSYCGLAFIGIVSKIIDWFA